MFLQLAGKTPICAGLLHLPRNQAAAISRQLVEWGNPHQTALPRIRGAVSNFNAEGVS
jgi:hypothetical protein